MPREHLIFLDLKKKVEGECGQQAKECAKSESSQGGIKIKGKRFETKGEVEKIRKK